MAFFEGKKIINPASLRERLDHAADAIREWDQITAFEWQEKYPDMQQALRGKVPGEDVVQCLHRELTLRLAEYIAGAPLPRI